MESHDAKARGDPVRSAVAGPIALQPVAGGRLVVVGDTGATVLNARTLKILKRVQIPPSIVVGHGGDAVSSDGRTLALDTQSGAVWFVDLATGKARAAQGTLPAPGVSAEFSPDGRTLATGAADGTVIVWDVATGAVVQRLTGHSSIVLDGVFSPDGKTLYTCSLDGAIFAWDIGRKRSFGTPFVATSPAHAGTGPDESSAQSGAIPPLAVSPDGRLFARGPAEPPSASSARTVARSSPLSTSPRAATSARSRGRERAVWS